MQLLARPPGSSVSIADFPTIQTLKERALLAHLDKKAAMEEYLIRATEEACWALFGEPPHITQIHVQGTYVEFTVDELKFKMSLGTSKGRGAGNESIEGIRDNESRKIYAFIGTGWHEIEELADLGLHIEKGK